MQFDLTQMENTEAYFLMTQTILPRPVAWVLSQNENGSLNLAPFSYFNAVASKPATVVLSIGSRPDGRPKDTRKNILAGRPFVIHLGSQATVKELNASAGATDPEVSELDLLGLRTVPFGDFPVPRLADAKVAFTARYAQHVLVGENKQAVIFAELLDAWVDDAAIFKDGKKDGRLTIDPAGLDPLLRLGGVQYARMGEVFSEGKPRLPG